MDFIFASRHGQFTADINARTITAAHFDMRSHMSLLVEVLVLYLSPRTSRNT